jgi:hypothetical protein
MMETHESDFSALMIAISCQAVQQGSTPTPPRCNPPVLALA